MKITLRPEFPNFYFIHRGVACRLRLGYSQTDRNGKTLYQVDFSYNWMLTEDFDEIKDSNSFRLKKKYRSKWDKFREDFVRGYLFEFTQTQDEVMQKAVTYLITCVNEKVDARDDKKKAFDAINTEIEIPAN